MEFIIIYCLGGLIYAGIELLWRGWTHWTMLLCGGLCFYFIYYFSGTGIPLYRKCVLCTAVIAVVEFLTGCIVNLKLNWAIWDYSQLPFNLLGQICPQFLLVWLILSVPALYLCSGIRRLIT